MIRNSQIMTKAFEAHLLSVIRKYWSTTTRSLCTCSGLGQRRSQLSVLFYGSDKFSIETLKLFRDNNHLNENHCDKIIQSLHVVSGENSLVTNFCRQNSIKTLTWPYIVPQNVYDVGVVVSFGHLIPKESIEACKYGIINVHGSLLPRWRGPSPIHNAVMSGDEVTGVTIMKIVADKFDVGSILAKKEYHLSRRATTSSVYDDLSVIGAELILDTLLNLEQRLLTAYQQPKEFVTKAPKPKKSDGKLNFRNMSSIDIDRRVRAFTGLIDVYVDWPLKPDSFIYVYDMMDPIHMELIHVDRCLTKLFGIDRRLNPGSIFYHKPRKVLCFKCLDEKWVGFESLKIVTKRKMSAMDFFNGFISPHCKNGLVEVDSEGKLIVNKS